MDATTVARTDTFDAQKSSSKVVGMHEHERAMVTTMVRTPKWRMDSMLLVDL